MNYLNYNYTVNTYVDEDLKPKAKVEVVFDLEQLQDETTSYGVDHITKSLKMVFAEVVDEWRKAWEESAEEVEEKDKK